MPRVAGKLSPVLLQELSRLVDAGCRRLFAGSSAIAVRCPHTIAVLTIALTGAEAAQY